MTRHPVFLVFSCTVLLGSAPAQAEQALPDSANQQAVESTLAQSQTAEGIDTLVGKSADRCVDSSPAMELCQWSLGKRDPGWKVLSDAIDSGDRVALICELPRDGGRRAPGSCTAYPMRTNRDQFSLPNRSTKQARQMSLSERKRLKDRYQQTAGAWIGEAHDVVEMSRLLGSIPDRCAPADDTHQMCRWKLSSRDYGHGTVAAWGEVSSRKKLRFDCTFSLTGGPRDEACRAAVGT